MNALQKHMDTLEALSMQLDEAVILAMKQMIRTLLEQQAQIENMKQMCQALQGSKGEDEKKQSKSIVNNYSPREPNHHANTSVHPCLNLINENVQCATISILQVINCMYKRYPSFLKDTEKTLGKALVSLCLSSSNTIQKQIVDFFYKQFKFQVGAQQDSAVRTIPFNFVGCVWKNNRFLVFGTYNFLLIDIF